ncbi:uncharacterized protein LOC132282004 [Cornus florida]|uniref:uncharacterized protein LOC132282004 n=1 Tax=Cornus florida TaxID=4283 RepID=UPI00289C8423|nr:uncharacterized protein LOC132282004 [Cornus florida]
MGSSGGILVMWDKRWVSKLDFWVDRFSVSCVFSLEEDGFLWTFSGVYGHNDDDGRPLTWEDLICLIDLPLEGATFTWSSGRECPTLSRLDRFLLTGDWEMKFLNIIKAALARTTSDHIPLDLDCGGMRKRSSPFRFENMWLRTEGFMERVRSLWESYVVSGSPTFSLASKLRRLKEDLKKWSRDDFENLEWRKNRAFDEIANINRKEGEGSINEGLVQRRVECQVEIAEIALLEEISWRQKSKALWLREGDRNTKFFHRLANAHRRGNHIERITVDGELLSKEDDICKGVTSFFQNLFTKTKTWQPLLGGLHYSISDFDGVNLERHFSEEEVLRVEELQ